MDPFRSFEAALPAIIAEQPSSVTRRRTTRADTFGGDVVYTAGPYTVRIEPMKSQTGVVFDEKGTVARRLFELVGHNLPRMLEEGGKVVPLFKPEDEIFDQDSNRYVIISPQYCRGKMVQLTLELRG